MASLLITPPSHLLIKISDAKPVPRCDLHPLTTQRPTGVQAILPMQPTPLTPSLHRCCLLAFATVRIRMPTNGRGSGIQTFSFSRGMLLYTQACIVKPRELWHTTVNGEHNPGKSMGGKLQNDIANSLWSLLAMTHTFD